MNSDVLLVVILLVFGSAAFLFGLICVGFKVVSAVGRSIFKSASPPPPLGREGSFVCSQEHCRKVDERKGVYCCQCGTRRWGQSPEPDVRV